MATRHSKYARPVNDWYVEPAWTLGMFLDRAPWFPVFHDPCAGVGTIVDKAVARGLQATGADIVDRAGGRFPVRDYLTDTTIYPNVVCNPPYSKAEEIIRHAFNHVTDRIAVLVPLRFLASQGRYALYAQRRECEMVLILSKRPSIPTGTFLQEHGEKKRKNGSDDFAWIVFKVGGRSTPYAAIDWLVKELDYNPLD